MFKRLKAIIENTFRETSRNKLFIVLILMVIVFYIISLMLGELSFEEHQKILFDIGISSIHWFNLALSLFLGGASIRKEMDRQTYMTLLVTPLSRFEFILGKYLGFTLIGIFTTLLLSVPLLVLLKMSEFGINFLAVISGIAMESSVILLLSLLFHFIFSPYVAIFLTLGVFCIGNSIDLLYEFSRDSGDSFYQNLANTLSWIFPNLYQLNWRNFTYLSEGVPYESGILGLAIGLGWSGFLLILIKIIFERKKLN